jgi:F0F1-type ATP synthase assembly protein I
VGAAWRFTGSAAVGIGAGYLVDRQFGSFPWGIIAGAAVGNIIGFYAIVRTVEKLSQRRGD